LTCALIRVGCAFPVVRSLLLDGPFPEKTGTFICSGERGWSGSRAKKRRDLEIAPSGLNLALYIQNIKLEGVIWTLN